MAVGETLRIPVIRGFFAEQFAVNDTPAAMAYWQVYDRTAGAEVPRGDWRWDAAAGEVEIRATPWRQYTVSFLAWRIWEEISMYNHITNGWTKEHLLQLNPYRSEAQRYLQDWMRGWCDANPDTTVVRFTSLFYNFTWIWGADERNRNLFTDWASYDFTVCPGALDDFAKDYGYRLCAEDFVRQGKYNATHRVPDGRKRDWMAFIGAFVRRYARSLVDIVHAAGKQAYVFYDDSWVGLEPYNGHFDEFGFDGIIKCVFSGYEARLCVGVPARTHEIRFHPYLFPVGLGGAPTFSPGGQPGRDAMRYWMQVRRALLREKIERAGLGGYLHLTQDYPDFVTAMDGILAEFRAIGALHDAGAPVRMKPCVGVLTAWGALRSWTLSGHFHETDRHVLIHVLESLAGLPFDVRFLSFDDIRGGVPDGIDVILNAGEAGSAWSGGTLWHDTAVVDVLTAWAHGGGTLLGIGAPGAVDGFPTTLRMAHILGVDIDTGEGDCHGRWTFDVCDEAGLIPAGLRFAKGADVVLTDGEATVLATDDTGCPAATLHGFGRGQGIYLSGFSHDAAHTRLLQNLLVYAATGSLAAEGVTDNLHTECAVFPDAGQILFINNSDEPQQTTCVWQGRRYTADLAACDMKQISL